MHGTRRLLTLLLLLLSPLPATADALRVVATPDVIADYQRLVGNRKPVDISDYRGPGSRRDVVELLLVHQALALAGESRSVTLVPVPTYQRMLALVADGRADLTGSTVWASDIDANAARLQASSAFVADGQFVAGVFHAAGANGTAVKLKERDWASLTAVSSRTWTPDWTALQRLGLSSVYDTGEWPAMVRMVGAGRADFLLAPFQPGSADGGDPAIHFEGITLVPVPGLCIALPGSRHVAVARTAGGSRVLQRLEQGLAQLQRRQAIQRAYTDAGFLTGDQRACHPMNGR